MFWMTPFFLSHTCFQSCDSRNIKKTKHSGNGSDIDAYRWNYLDQKYWWFSKKILGCFRLCKYSFSRYSLFQSRIKIILVVSIFLFDSSKSSHSQFVSRGILMLRVALKVDIKYYGMILIELSLSRFITIWWYK